MTDEYFDGDDTGGDISSDVKDSANSDTGADSGDNLAEDTGVDLNGDTAQCLENEADAGEAANADMGEDENSEEDLNLSDISARDAVATAAMSNADSPKLPAQVIGSLLPGDYPGGPASDARSRLAQMGIDGVIAGSAEMMEGAIRQYGLPAEAQRRNIQMQIDAQALDNHEEDT
jgi:hypothetical protein